MTTSYDITRASLAYFNGSQLPQDTLATCLSLRCSVSDGEYVAGDYIVWPIRSGFYATRLSYRARVYKWDDNTSTWVFNGTVPSPVHSLFELISGDLLAGGEDGKVYRSVNQGGAWVKVHDLSDSCLLDPWFFHQATNGTIIFDEYSNAKEGRKIYRSVDSGATLEVVHNASKGDHYHAVVYVTSLSRWIIAHGDFSPYWWMTKWGNFPICLTDNHQYVLYSDDDGQAQTWKALFTPGDEPDFQPIAFLDYGDEEGKVLFGSDRYWQAGTFNAGTGEINQVLHNLRRQADRCYVPSLFYDEDEDLYYASQLDNSTSETKCPGIWVSRNRTDWALYHTFTNNERVATIVGKYGGKIHARVAQADGSDAHFAVTPATATSEATGPNYLVEPGVTNLLNTPGQSSLESNYPEQEDWFYFWQAYSWYASDGQQWSDQVRSGNQAYRVDSTTVIDAKRWLPEDSSPSQGGQYYDKCALAVGRLNTGINIPSGAFATGRIALTTTDTDLQGDYRADRHLGCSVGFRDKYGANLTDHVDQRVHLEPGVWKEIELDPYHNETQGAQGVVIVVECAQEGLGARTIIADCAQIALNTGGTSWQLGGTEREDAHLVATEPAMSAGSWTNVFKFEPALESLQVPMNWCVRTWTNETDYLKLFWNRENGSFDLEIKRDGEVVDTLSVPLPYFPRRAQILVGLVLSTSTSESSVTIYIAGAQGGSSIPYDETGGVSEDWSEFFTGESMEATSGDASGADIFPHWLDSSFDLFFDTGKNATQVRDIMNTMT